jgi:pimeloyl-ACP methyl ester carboxylesterase
VAEWFKAAVLKTAVPQGTVGSNPTPSAIHRTDLQQSSEGISAMPASVVRETVISHDGVPISYEVRGTGAAALVFVHGWSCKRSSWAGQLEPFSREFQVVAVDLAGHGESGTGRESWTIAAFGEDVAAVVKKLGLRRIVLIGHSMGGDVIIEAARRLPGRVAGLVWVDTYRRLGDPMTPDEVQAFVAPFRTAFQESASAFFRGMFPPGSNPALVERMAGDVAAAPPAIALKVMEAALSFEGEVMAALPELKLPLIAINPDYRPTHFESMKRFGIDVVLMPGVGHFLMMENPEGFNPLLRGAVEKLLR